MQPDVFAPVCPSPRAAPGTPTMQAQAAPVPYCLRTCGLTTRHTSAGHGTGLHARPHEPAFIGRARQRGTR